MAIKILIIDDEPMIIKILSHLLSLDDYKIISAVDGVEGIEKFDAENPDFVLLDMKMPKMDGMETLKRLRRKSQTVPIVIMTGNNDKEIEDESFWNGSSAYVEKPFAYDKVKKMIEFLLTPITTAHGGY